MMKYLLLICVLYFSSIKERIIKQTKTTNSDTTVYKAVEKAPEFPGGDVELGKYLIRNVQLTKHDYAPPGKVVVEFVVEINGSTGYFKTISGNKKVAAKLFNVLKRVKWQPGYNNDKPVRALVTLPFSCIMPAAE